MNKRFKIFISHDLAHYVNEDLKKDLQEIRDDLNKIPTNIKPFCSPGNVSDWVFASLVVGSGRHVPPLSLDEAVNTLSPLLEAKPNTASKMYSYLHEVGHVTHALIGTVKAHHAYINALAGQEADDFCGSDLQSSELACNIATANLFEQLHQKLLKLQQKVIRLQTVIMPLLVAWAYTESAFKDTVAFCKNLIRFTDRLLLLTGYSLTAFLGRCLVPFDKSWAFDLNELHRQMINQKKSSWAILLVVPMNFLAILLGGLQIALFELFNTEEDLIASSV